MARHGIDIRLTPGLNIFILIFVATTVHIPAPLLAAAERRARALRISRNRLIVRALERELGEAEIWSEEFLDALRKTDNDTAEAVNQLVAEIKKRRVSTRKPPEL